MKKVLIITYYWPPAGGPGVQRVLKFVKYLPEFGFQPYVLTVENGDYPAIDESLLKEVPESLKVFKVHGWEPYKIYRKLTSQKPESHIPVAILNDVEDISIGRKITNWIRLNIFIPDARRFLIKPFVKAGLDIIKNEKIDLIITSSPPQSIQLAGKQIKSKSGLPWIADLRDPWTKIFYYQNVKRLKIAQIVDESYEKSVLKNSDAIITVSNPIMEQFLNIVPSKKSQVIFNGYDEDDFIRPKSQVAENRNTMTLLYYGNLMKDQVCISFVEALKNVINRLDGTMKIKLEMIGNIHQDFKVLINQYSLGSYVNYIEYMDHDRLIGKGFEADLLLLFINNVPDNKGILTGKLFEYLGYSKPVLALGPDGNEAGKILNDSKSGKMFEYDDVESIQNFIMYYSQKLGVSLNNNSENYTRRNQTRKLSDLISEVLC